MSLINLVRRALEIIVPSDGSHRNKGTWNLPSGAVMAATTTAAADYGAWAELITAAANTVDRWVTQIILRGDEVAEIQTLQIGIGAAGSEVAIITVPIMVATAEDVLIVTLPHPFKIAAGQRMAARSWADTDAGTIDVKLTGNTGLGVTN